MRARNLAQIVFGTIAFAATIVVFDAFLCPVGDPKEADPEAKIITVTFVNNGDDNIHILGPGDAPPPANRLAPGATRTWTSPGPVKRGASITFTASRSGGTPVSISRSCVVTRQVLEGTATNPRVAFDEPPAQLLCQGWL